MSRSSILAPSSSPPRSPLKDVTGGAEKSCSPRSSPASRSRSASARPSARNTTTTFTTRRLAASLAPPWRRGGFSGSTRKRSHGRSAMRARWPSAFGSSTRKVRCRNTFTRDTPPRAGFAPRSSPRMVSRAPARSWKASAGSSLGWLRKASRTKVTAGLGEAPLALPGVSLKPYASCRHTHAAIDAAMALREELDGHAVERGTISVYQAAADLCDNPSPKTPYEAKFSLQYCVAEALGGRSMGLDDFGATGNVANPVAVVVDADLTARFPSQFPARLSLELSSGDELEREVAFPLGDPENPLSRARVEAKLFELAAFGGATRHGLSGALTAAWISLSDKCSRASRHPRRFVGCARAPRGHSASRARTMHWRPRYPLARSDAPDRAV